MSTPITEAHLRLANQLVASQPSPLVMATLIADSEARYGAYCLQRVNDAENESAKLRAEVERLTAQRENLLKPMRDRAIARAERAEAELTFQQERNSRLFEQRDAAVEAQDKAETELAAERAR
jgi:hypothetical protein